MPPFMGGGDMIRKVSLRQSTWNDLPWKFEAGTPAIAEAIGLGVAVDYLNALGMERVQQHEQEMTSYALEQLQAVPGITIYGPAANQRGGSLIQPSNDASASAGLRGGLLSRPSTPLSRLHCDTLSGRQVIDGLQGGVISFTIGDIHPHDLASILDQEAGVAVRAGHHCAQPLMERLGLAATARASFYVYTIKEEIDALVKGLHRAIEIFRL
jgi:cysteine desulfurase / selenocysteine lyase